MLQEFSISCWNIFGSKSCIPSSGTSGGFGQSGAGGIGESQALLYFLSYLSHIWAIRPLRWEHQRILDLYQGQFHPGKCKSVQAGLGPPQRSSLSYTHIWRCLQMWLAFRPSLSPWDLWRLEEEAVWGKPPSHNLLGVGGLVPSSCPTNKSCWNLEDGHRLFWTPLRIHICNWGNKN